MTKQKYHIEDSEWEEILAINKEGSDPVMYLSGGIPLFRSKQEKINDFWQKLSAEKRFDMKTIEPISDRDFLAEPIIKEN